jgi:hypothetical protein
VELAGYERDRSDGMQVILKMDFSDFFEQANDHAGRAADMECGTETFACGKRFGQVFEVVGKITISPIFPTTRYLVAAER